jgi:hypothetical protein
VPLRALLSFQVTDVPRRDSRPIFTAATSSLNSRSIMQLSPFGAAACDLYLLI